MAAANAENVEQYTGEEAGQQSGDLAVFSDLESQLGELRAFDASRHFEYRTSAGNKEARSHVWKLRRTKTAVDEARKAATKPLRQRIDAINAEGKRLVGEIDGMIQPHQAEIERVEAEEQARVEALQEAVRRLRDWPSAEPEAGAERLREMAAEAEALEIDAEEWGDYAAPAEHARDKAAAMLRFRADQAAKTEAAEAERERERQQREQERAEREREQAELEELRREKAEREAREAAEAAEREAAKAAEAAEAAEEAKEADRLAAAAAEAAAVESDAARDETEPDDGAVADAEAEAVEGDGSGEALPEFDSGFSPREAGVDEHRERREMMRAEAVEAIREVSDCSPADAFAILDAIIDGHVPHVRFDGGGA